MAAVEEGDAGERWRAEARGESGQILSGAVEIRVDGIGDPAGEGRASGGEGFAGEERVVETAQPQADDQEHGYRERGREVGHGRGVADRG